MDEDFADYALQEALTGAQWAEVRLESSVDNALLWKNGVLENVAFGEQEGLSVRVLVDGALGFAATNIVDRVHVRRVAREAVKMASLQRRQLPVVFSEEKAVEAQWEVQQKNEFPGVEEKIGVLEQIDADLLSVRMLLLISNTTELMEEEPVSKASIQIREKIALPLLVIQQYALQKASEETSLKETYEKLVTRTLYGNINAGRNSA